MRTFFPIDEFDNAFGGTKMIAGEMGTVVNAGNRDETGSFWNLRRPAPPITQDVVHVMCRPPAPWRHWSTPPRLAAAWVPPPPVYGDGPQCNTRGITFSAPMSSTR